LCFCCSPCDLYSGSRRVFQKSHGRQGQGAGAGGLGRQHSTRHGYRGVSRAATAAGADEGEAHSFLWMLDVMCGHFEEQASAIAS